jgi:hypothetical protein
MGGFRPLDWGRINGRQHSSGHDIGRAMKAMTLEEQIRHLESRLPRYDSAMEAVRMADFRAAYGMCELDGAEPWTPAVERLFKLLASGRITDKQYVRLARISVQTNKSQFVT